MKLRRPSPALVISIIALVIAVGTGGAIAQSRLGNNTVTSAKIKNRSVRGVDIARGTVSLSNMTKGTQNRINRGGGGGRPANANALEAYRKTGPAGQPANLGGNAARLTLQPGAYVITAKAILSGFLERNSLQNLLSSTESATGSCKLEVGGDEDLAVGQVIVGNRPATSTLHMQLTRTLGGTADALLTCSAQTPVNVTNSSIIATKVESVTRSESTG